MIGDLLSIYRPRFAKVIVYMLQASEYQVLAYLKWLERTKNFNRVMRRRELVMTRPAKLLLRTIRAGMLIQILLAAYLAYRPYHVHHSLAGLVLVAAFLLSTPVVWAYLAVVPLIIGRWLFIKPYYFWAVRKSAQIFARHPGAKIAVAGSYGKTTMKEILATILGEGHKVAATPANKNVPISHAQFAKSLAGDEDILIIEYGEGAPGDVARFARKTHPNMGVITGLAPAHLDKYKTLAAAARDIFSLADYLGGQEVYVSGESEALKPYIKDSYVNYSAKGVAGWKISHINVGLTGLSFVMKKGKQTLELKSQLVGKHLVAPLALAAYFANELGMSPTQIEKAVAAVKPFEHRMQPYQLNGAWIIDDTYNGNIDGMKAGLELLKELPAKRKIYVTPGLVDQGPEEASVHRELGAAIKAAKPDKIVLMHHSVTDYIREGLAGYKGEVIIEDDPLNFYLHLDKFVADGDLVLMQNDWPDNYN